MHALPVLAFIKSADPTAEIHWLVEGSFAPLLEGHHLVRKVKRVSTKTWRNDGAGRFLMEVVGVLRDLRNEKYDIALDLQGNSKSGLFTMFCGAPARYGFDRKEAREWPNVLATTHRISLGESVHHISDRSLAVAEAAFPKGRDRPLAGPLPVDDRVLEGVEKKLERENMSRGPIVVLHHGTTWETKKWPVANWGSLAAELCTKMGLRPVLTWGNEEELKVVEKINQASSCRSLIWPRGDLLDLAGLLKRADVVVGTDTGPIHIAAAVGTPTVSIYRVTDSRRNGPRGENHILLQSPLDCSPCLKKECDRNDECANGVRVEEVIAAITALMENAGDVA